MHLVVVGHAACDVIFTDKAAPTPPVLGGPASYISLAAAALGADVDLITVAPVNEPLLGLLEGHPNITLNRVAEEPLTRFALDYTLPVREVRLRHRASAITSVPTRLRDAKVAILAPAFGELGPACFDWFPKAQLTIALQGMMRSARADGTIEPIDPPPLPRTHAVSFSEHDHPHARDLAAYLARSVPVVALTRGDAGSIIFFDGTSEHVAAAPAVERDPTGAGDVFTAALAVHLARGASPLASAAKASYAAARAVEGPGLGTLTR